VNAMEFIVIVLLLAIPLLAIRGHYQNKARRLHAQGEEAEARELRERLTALEERIKVLERIVTDERYDLKQRFRDLERAK
jgi:hypothetical protein